MLEQKRRGCSEWIAIWKNTWLIKQTRQGKGPGPPFRVSRSGLPCSAREAGSIPVVILTTSKADEDIIESFELQASGYIRKPVSLEEFQDMMHSLSDYWFVICKRVYHDNICQQASNDRCFAS